MRTTKQDVADAGLALFCERGYHAVTVDEIAAAAGVTKGAFYYYFADKDDLAADLWQALWRRLAAAAAARYEPDADVAVNVKQCVRAVIDAIGDLGEARFFLRDAWVLPLVEVAGRTDQDRASAVLASFFGDATSIGVLAGLDPEAAARVLLGAFAEAVLHILSTGDADPALAVLDRVVDAVLGPPGPTPRRLPAPGDPLAAPSATAPARAPRRPAAEGGGPVHARRSTSRRARR